MTVNSLVVIRDKRGFKYLANEYVGVFIAYKIDLNLGVLLRTILCTLGLLYEILGLNPTRQALSNFFLKFFSNS